jgi:hypothetical protein
MYIIMGIYSVFGIKCIQSLIPVQRAFETLIPKRAKNVQRAGNN